MVSTSLHRVRIRDRLVRRNSLTLLMRGIQCYSPRPRRLDGVVPLCLTPVLLLDRDLIKFWSDFEDEEDDEDARRWRCMRLGSMSGILAS